MLAAAVKLHWQGFQCCSFKCDVLHEVCHESSVLHSYRWPAVNFTQEERNWGLEILGYRCLGQPWLFWGCSDTVCCQPARHWQLLSCLHLWRKCLVTSVVALMDILWLFWFSSAGAAQGSCCELVCRKAFVALIPVRFFCILLWRKRMDGTGWTELTWTSLVSLPLQRLHCH